MKHPLFVTVVTGLLISGVTALGAEARSRDVLNRVDPFIGTGFHGHTFPGATTPFGMVQLSPDTRINGWDACGGYYRDDTEIWGFSHTHLSGTGIGDYGDFLIMPYTGDVGIGTGTLRRPDYAFRSAFSPDNEQARPGYYQVYLERYGVNAELSATPRVGVHRYTFPEASQAGFIIDLTHIIQAEGREILEAGIEVLNEREVAGWRHVRGWAPNRWIFFHAKFSQPFTADLFVNDKLQGDHVRAAGKHVKAKLKFATSKAEQVLVKVGLSPVDAQGARGNLEAEMPGWDFDGVVRRAEDLWRRQLGRVEISGGTADQRTLFYTALYHASICPNLSSDVDGRYRGMDQEIHHDRGHANYTVFSLWDTFRAQHPLQTIINPDLDQAWIRALLRQYDEGGILPMWGLAANYTGCMIGYHAVPVIVDAYMKGLRDYDLDKAMEAILFSSVYDDKKPIPYNRDQVRENLMPKAKLYNATKDFIPADLEVKSVSKALEFAYDDWAIATMAKSMGRDEVAAEYFKRAKRYREYFDPETGFMRGRNQDGSWVEPFRPTDSHHTAGEYVEGNAWQWTWFVPHDVPGLIELFGGREAFADKLEELFSTDSTLSGEEISMDITGLIGQYAHGNEPSHHIAYLFNWAGRPWRTQEIVHQIMTEFYRAAPAGLIGNEDCGQMSAWFILSALGIYQVAPGDPRFSLGRPLFDETRVAVGHGREFVVKMKDGGPDHPYVQRVTLNGRAVRAPFISYDDIMSGGELMFEMGSQKRVFWSGH